MSYTIQQVTKITGISAHTLRYYEKEGLLSDIARSGGGIRLFSDADLEQLNHITCLKGTGMPIKEIKRYIDLCNAGEDTCAERLAILTAQREQVLQQIADLQNHLVNVDRKIEYYNDCCKHCKH